MVTIDGLQMAIKYPTSGGQTCNQEAAVWWTLKEVVSNGINVSRGQESGLHSVQLCAKYRQGSPMKPLPMKTIYIYIVNKCTRAWEKDLVNKCLDFLSTDEAIWLVTSSCGIVYLSPSFSPQSRCVLLDLEWLASSPPQTNNQSSGTLQSTVWLGYGCQSTRSVSVAV